jgi:hypothetical protein
VDARRGPEPGDNPEDRVVAQWFSDKQGERGVPGETSHAVMQQELRRAAAGAERAVEGQVIAPRYSDLVRRVFRRYAQRVESPRPPDPPPGGP